MEQVQRQRRRNRVISLAAIALIAVVAVTVVVYSLSARGNAVPLPGYLDRCVVSTLLYHAHPGLAIVINGTTFPVPPDVGRTGACNRPIHTHPSNTNPSVFDGTLHVETDENRDYTLGDFFLIWGNSENNPTLAILNSNQIFGNHVVAGHTMNVTINGGPSPNPDPSKIVIPRNAQENSGTAYNIAISYS